MATVDFGIIQKIDADRDYSVLDSYQAAMHEFRCVSVDDEFAEHCFEELSRLPVSYGILHRRGEGPDLCGVSLIAYEDVPEALDAVKKMRRSFDFDEQGDGLNGEGGCSVSLGDEWDLTALLEEVIRTKAYLIIFGI